MKITMEMLLYLLGKVFDLTCVEIGKEGLDLQGGPGDLLVEYPVKDHTRGQTWWIRHKKEGANRAAVQADLAEGELEAAILAAYVDLIRWEGKFAQAILKGEDPKKILSWGREMLDWEYAVVKRNWQVLYISHPHGKLQEDLKGHRYQEAIENLTMSRDYHKAASCSHPFYYHEALHDRENYCANIFRDGQYFARLVMRIGKGGSRISSGAGQIFQVFADYLNDLVHYDRTAFRDPTSDQLHGLCRSLVAKKPLEEAVVDRVLAGVGWKKKDRYVVYMIQFYAEGGWDPQYETTLPFLAWELERVWINSCAVCSQSSILWVINASRSDADTNQHSFHQQVASFMRDHVCHVGVSTMFSDLYLLPWALETAEVALEMGREKHPQFWYYRFDDYRTDFMLRRMKGDMPWPLLRHPAIEILEEKDQKKQGELSETLRMYLVSGLNMTKAASQLYIHRTTFCRRMEQIRELTGLDLDQADVLLSLLLSYRLRDDRAGRKERGLEI